MDNGQAKRTKRPDGSDGMTVTFTLKDDLVWAELCGDSGDHAEMAHRRVEFEKS